MGPTPETAAVRLAVRRCLAELSAASPTARPDSPLILVACSGGADSVALAAGLAFEAPRAGVRAGGVTVDHGLQVGSARRARQVAEMLRTLRLDPVEVLTASAPAQTPTQSAAAVTPPRLGPEGQARTSRYALLAEAAARLGATAVLLGHTRDDQAETLLLGLARGSGARSLAGMSATRDHYRRPLLELSRATVRSAADGLPVWEDPHNVDPSYARSRVRSTVLPTLERELGPGVAAALARTATQLREDADALDVWAAAALESARTRASVPASSGTVPLDVDILAALPTAVRTRVLRRAAIAAGSPANDLTAVHIGAMDGLLTHWHGQGPLQLPGRVEATRACGTLALATRPSGSSR